MNKNNKLAKTSDKKHELALGEGSMFWIDEGDEFKRGFKAKVSLTYPTHFCFPAGANAKPMITGEGYDRINQYAGIEVFKPKTLINQLGDERGNPFFETDDNGSLVAVMMRGIGIGYAPTGNLTAIDQTIYINLQTVLIQEIQSKMKNHPGCATLGVSNKEPEKIQYYETSGWGKDKKIGNMKEVEVRGVWHFIPLHGHMGYWVNLSHPEIQDAFSSFSQKQRFLERTTFTILKRLILSSHPAIATKTPIITDKKVGQYNKLADAKGHVVVYGFRQTNEPQKKREELVKVAERLDRGEKIADMHIDLTKKEAVDISEEEEIADATLVADPNELPPMPEVADDVESVPDVVEPDVEVDESKVDTNNDDATKQLSDILKDSSLSPHIINTKKAMGFAKLSDVRKAGDDKKLEFVKKVMEAAND